MDSQLNRVILINKMKSFYLTLSILTKTNRAVANSEEDWSSIRDGSYIKIADDNTLYTVSKKQSFFYIDEFEVFQNNKIKIKKDTGADLLIGDIVDLSYKQYEIDDILEIVNPSNGYKINDLVSFEGKAVLNKIDNTYNEAILRVKSIGPNGEVQSVKIEKPGIYTELPEIINLKGGASIKISIKRNTNHSAIENEIINIDKANNETIITLGYSLPNNIKNGKLSCKKYELFIDRNYIGDNKFDVKYEVLRDMTPFLNLPYLVKNSANFETFYNQSLNILDSKIKELQDQINKLK